MSLRECFQGALRIVAVLASIFGGGLLTVWLAAQAGIHIAGVLGGVVAIIILIVGVIAIATGVVAAFAWEPEENR